MRRAPLRLLVFLLAVPAPSVAAPVSEPSLAARLEPSVAKVGDVVLLHLSIGHAAADALVLPAELDFGDLELIDKSRASVEDGPMVTEELVFKLVAFEVGPHVVPAIKVKVADTDFATPELTLSIESVLPPADPTKAAPATPKQDGNEDGSQRKPDGEPLSVREALYWPWFVAAAALLAAAGYLLLKRRRPKDAKAAIAPELRIPAHQAALQLFKLLRQKNYLTHGAYREHYFEASEIVRGYLGQRFGINALDLTTAELALKLDAISAPGLDRDNLRRWLEHGDLVKFAKHEPPREQGTAMLDFFESLVWNTRPPEPKALVAGAA